MPISQLYGHIIGIHRRIGGEREGRWSREGGKRGGEDWGERKYKKAKVE